MFHVLMASNITNFGFNRKSDLAKVLVLNSEGGFISIAHSVVDLMELYPTPVIATGNCMSAAVPIVAAGKKGHRFATPKTRFMLHAGGNTYGKALTLDYMNAEAKEFKTSEKVYSEIMAEHTGTHSANWWFKKCNRESCWYFSPEEALELGIIDKIITKPFRYPKVKKRKK